MAREKLTRVTIPTATAGQMLVGLFILPEDMCCNCGGADGLRHIVTPVPVADFSQEKTLRLPFPYCARCVPTAVRLPPRFGRSLLLFPVVFFAIVFALGAMGSLIGHGLHGDDSPWVLGGAAVTALALSVWLLRWRPPEHPGQTSRYQAVRVDLHKSFLGKVESVTLAFTNPSYAHRFREAWERAKSAMPELAARA